MNYPHDNTEARGPLAMLRCTRGDVLRAFAVIALVCASFTAVASLVLVAYTRANPELDFIDAPGGLWLRAGLFALVTFGAFLVLAPWRSGGAPAWSAALHRGASRGSVASLVVLIIGIVLLLANNLGQYPFAAPDEVHHLVVTRNLAEYGAYASGRPEGGFKYFDSFDSVGPVVLGPIAVAFKIFGVHLAVARGVMVMFFVGLCLATYGFNRGLFGARAALVSVALLLGTYSSIYLARTLYGEVPAYFFLLLGLLAWRRALESGRASTDRVERVAIGNSAQISESGLGGMVPPGCGGGGGVNFKADSNRAGFHTASTPPAPPQAGGNDTHGGPPAAPQAGGNDTLGAPPAAPKAEGACVPGGHASTASLWGFLAGVLVGCAVLAKTILILIAFSFLGAWVYDRATHRRIGWRAVVLPVIGGALVLGCWSFVQRVHGPDPTEAGGVLAIYQHYLLFGVSSFVGAFKHAILPHPMAHLAWLGVIVVTVPVLFRHRYDPPAITLYLYALFLLYWWFFFTPGHLHRYLWNAYAILAIFAAPWLLLGLKQLATTTSSRWKRAFALGAVIMLSWPGIHWSWFQASEIRANEEMAPEYALVDAVAAWPPATRLGTDVDRLPGLLNFFASRVVETGPDALLLLEEFDVVITRDTPELRAALPASCRVQPAGNFVLLSIPKTTE